MSKPLLGEKVAVLVANGFSEDDLTSTQKALIQKGADVRIIGMDGGLVNSWNGTGWGLNFAVDHLLSESLAVDYTMLLIPGGQRSADKLQLTAHTRRFVNGFLNSAKPVAVFSEAFSLVPEEHQDADSLKVGPKDSELSIYANDVIAFFEEQAASSAELEAVAA